MDAPFSGGVERLRLETMYSTVDDRIATIVLNRPRVLNCANQAWLDDFNVILDDLEEQPGLRAIVVRGAGRAFCTGIDLTALSQGDIDARFFRGWEVALRRLETLDALSIAAVHAHCIGGGLQLALACDIRVARDDATFGVTATKEGIIPGMGMWRIARHAGLGRAKRLALLADVVDAYTARDWGLVDHVVGPDAYESTIADVARRVLDMAPTSTRLTKRLINMAFDTSWSEFVDVFCEYQEQSTAAVEHRQAMAERREQRARRPSLGS